MARHNSIKSVSSSNFRIITLKSIFIMNLIILITLVYLCAR